LQELFGSLEQMGKIKAIVTNRRSLEAIERLEKVQAILDGDRELAKQYSKVYQMICDAYDLSRILNKKRQKRGCINFETKECKVILDEKGNVADIKPYPYLVSNSIIEEFMLDIMYEIPKDDNIGTVVITKDYVEGSGGPLITMRQGIIPSAL